MKLNQLIYFDRNALSFFLYFHPYDMECSKLTQVDFSVLSPYLNHMHFMCTRPSASSADFSFAKQKQTKIPKKIKQNLKSVIFFSDSGKELQ